MVAFRTVIQAAISIHRIDDEGELYSYAAKKHRSKADAEGQLPPSSISKALHHENIEEAYRWLDAINKEWDGLIVQFLG